MAKAHADVADDDGLLGEGKGGIRQNEVLDAHRFQAGDFGGGEMVLLLTVIAEFLQILSLGLFGFLQRFLVDGVSKNNSAAINHGSYLSALFYWK